MALVKDHYHEVPDADVGDQPIVVPLAPLEWNAESLQLTPPAGEQDAPAYLELDGDAGDGEGGWAYLNGGAGASGEDGGGASLRGGTANGGFAEGGTFEAAGGAAAGDGGTARVYGGAAEGGGNGDGGDVHLRPGNAAGSGRAGLVIIETLPVIDPEVVNALWNDAGTLKVSAG